ncbi:MAG: HlyD family type I secretion periplasmic adaptor subunit [Pseudomonadota bacterium]
MEISPSIPRPPARDQLKYLSKSALLEETAGPSAGQRAAVAIALSLGIFLAWAAATPVREVAVAEGSVIPTGYVRAVQHLEGGIVREILVREGEPVETGDVLVRIEDAAAVANLRELQTRQLGLEMQAERLRAIVDNREPDLERYDGAHPWLSLRQRGIHQGALAAHRDERRVIEEQIRQSEAELRAVLARRQAVEANLPLVTEARDMQAELLKRGFGRRLEFIERERALNSLHGEHVALSEDVDRLARQIEEFRRRARSLTSQRRMEALSTLGDLEPRIAENEEALMKLRDRVTRLDVTAPVSGMVKGVQVTTIGGVVSPGQTLLEVVPARETLVVEARIKPDDVGHVHVGQAVRVKLTAYDHSRFGALEGELAFVSPTTFADETGAPYYLGRIQLASDRLTSSAYDLPVRAGMVAEAEIVTGEKSVLSYLMKPISASLDAAMRER